MPSYPGVANATVPVKSNLSPLAIAKGDSVYLFGVLAAGATQLPVNESNVAGETPAAPQASIAIHLAPTSEAGPPPMICIEGLFSGAPGAFSLQIQEADTDADGFYTTPSTSTYTITAVGSNQQFRIDLSPTGGKFLRAYLASRTNGVSLILKATRLA